MENNIKNTKETKHQSKTIGETFKNFSTSSFIYREWSNRCIIRENEKDM